MLEALGVAGGLRGVLVACRVAGLVACLPTLIEWAGWKTRVVLIVLLTVILAPVAPHPPHSPATWTSLGILAVSEVLVGSLLALAAGLVLGGVQLAAELIDQQLGLTLTEGLALGGEGGVGIAATLYRLLATFAFVELGGHLQVVTACADSFHALPPGCAGDVGPLWSILRELVPQSFILALRVAGPVWGSTILAALACGLVGRVLPGVQGSTWAAPCRVGVGLLALAWGMPIVAQVVDDACPRDLRRALDAAAEAGRMPTGEPAP